MARKRVSLDQPSFPEVDFEKQPAISLNGGLRTATAETEIEPLNLGEPVKVTVPDFADPKRPKTCLEVDFPIVPVNALSQLEGNAGKPIYQMSKWWARRRSSVFRAMLLAAAMQAPIRKNPDGTDMLDSEGVPVPDETEAAKKVWDVYYANHQKAGNFQNLKVLDCFMGGGTTLVEGSRLGFQLVGVDLNPVAWFVVKNELDCTDPADLSDFFKQVEAVVKPRIQPFYVTECPRGHHGRWFRLNRTGLSSDDEQMPFGFDPLKLTVEERQQYRYEGPEVIYTFWAKHSPCGKIGCGHRTPIFRTPVIAEKRLGVKYIELSCKKCKTVFHAELGAARVAPGAERIVLETEVPFTELSQPFAQRLLEYNKGTAPEVLQRAKELASMVETEDGLKCPRCRAFSGEFLRDVLGKHSASVRRRDIDKKHFNIQPPRNGTKPVYSYLLIDPEWLKGCDGLADGSLLGGYSDAPVAKTGEWFHRRMENLRLIEVRGRVRISEDNSGQLADMPDTESDSKDGGDEAAESANSEAETPDRKEYGLPTYIALSDGRRIDTRRGTVVAKGTVACRFCGEKQAIIEGLRKVKYPAPLMPYALQCFCPECKANAHIYEGRYFSAPSTADVDRLLAAFVCWDQEQVGSLAHFWPKDPIPFGWQTHFWSIPDHGYTHWYRMFNPRQLLVLASLLRAITQASETPRPLREQALGAFQQYLRNQCMFCIYDLGYDKLVPFFSNNHFVAKQLVLENSVFPRLGRGNWESCTRNVVEGIEWCREPWEPYFHPSEEKSAKVYPGDAVIPANCSVRLGSSSDLDYPNEHFDLVITDPPFGDNFIYSEMANFFYAWVRIPLSSWYEDIRPLKASPYLQEAVKNVAHHPDDADAFYQSMMTACWSEACRKLKPGGIMAFTFHHSEDTQWAIVLEALFDAGFFIEAIYPVTSDESKGENAEFGSKKIEYDMLHVCRKRLTEPGAVSWPKMRQWVRTELSRLKQLLASYKANDLSDADIRVIMRGKALEFYSRHYGNVLTSDHEPMSISHALAGINQLLDEGSGGSEMRPPAIVEPVAYQYLRLFTTRSSYESDEVTKNLFGTTIRLKDLVERGWVEERNRVVTAVPIFARFEVARQRPRKEMKTEIDQAHFLIGSAMPKSGVDLEQELSKDTWMLRRSVDSVLEWYAASALHGEVRAAAGVARAILRRSVEKLRQRPGALEEQLSLFNDWDEAE